MKKSRIVGIVEELGENWEWNGYHWQNSKTERTAIELKDGKFEIYCSDWEREI